MHVCTTSGIRRRIAGSVLVTAFSLTAAAAVAAPPLSPLPVRAIEEIRIPAEAGRDFRAIVSGPADAAAAIIYLHDWFGVSEMTRRTVERLSQPGYRVIGLDLYDGVSATTHADATSLMNAVDRETREAALNAAIDYAAERHASVAVVGFSMGGFEAYRAATLAPDRLAAVAIVYAGGMEDAPDKLGTLGMPLLLITGSLDQWAAPSMLETYRLLDAAGMAPELYVYPGVDHAFAQPLFNEGANFNADATEAAFSTLQRFLDRHLGE